MRSYGLVRVKREPHTGRILQAQLCEFDGGRNRWVGEPFVMDAPAIARLIANGDRVHAIFGPTTPRPVTWHGAKFRTAEFEDEYLGIELEEESENRTVDDLLPLE